MASQIKESIANIYATYGMTETITHIAAKKLNKSTEETHFETLPNVKVSQDKRGCLVINAIHLSQSPIVTNDVVKLHSSTSFELLGRFDNVINSGGIKIQPEQLEAALSPYITADFFIASQENETLGEAVILVIEGEEYALPNHIFSAFKKHEIPKDVIFIERFKRTSSGKINRNKTLLTSKKVS